MGKLSLYKSKKYLKRKQRKLTSGRPFKFSKFANRNKDIDTTLSYSDNCENDMSQSTRTHAMNFYCSGDPPCDSLLSAHGNSVPLPLHHLQKILLMKPVMLVVSVRREIQIQSILSMRTMCGTAHMPRIVWPC